MIVHWEPALHTKYLINAKKELEVMEIVELQQTLQQQTVLQDYVQTPLKLEVSILMQLVQHSKLQKLV